MILDVLIAELCLAYSWPPETVGRLTAAQALRYSAVAGLTARPAPAAAPTADPPAPPVRPSWDRAMLQMAILRGDERTARKIRGWLARDLVFGPESARA